MVALSTIRRIEVTATSNGVAETTAKLDALSRAQTTVAQTADGMAVKTESSSRRQLSAAGAFDRLRMKQDEVFRSSQELAKGQQIIDRAFQQGVISVQEQSRQMQLLTERYSKVASANDNLGRSVSGSMGLARHELINLSRQAQDVAVSLQGGQSPLTVLFQQGSQIGDVFATSKGTIAGFGAQLASLVTPARALAVGLVAVGAAAYAGYAYWKSYTLQLDDTARAAGVSTRELSKLQAAASFKGINATDFGQGIAGFGKSVYEARMNMGGLADLFQANNVKANTFDEYLAKGANLIRGARDDQQRLVLLQQMGLPATMEWVRLLANGADGLKDAKAKAAEFAASDDLIASARKFNETWNRAWTNFGLNARSAFQRALETGQSFFDRMDRLAKQAGNASIWTSLLPANHAEEAGKWGVTPLSSFEQRFNAGSSNPSSGNTALSDGLNRRAANLQKPTIDPAETARANQLESQRIGLLGQTATVGQQVRAVELQIAAARANHVQISEQEAATLLKLAREQANGTAAIKSQIDSVNVQAATVGMSAGAAAEYASKQTVLNEALRQHKVLTDADRAAIDEQAKALGRAVQAAAVKSAQSQADFVGQTMLMSQADMAAAQVMNNLYGDQWQSHMDDALAKQIKMNVLTQQVGDAAASLGNNLVQAFASGKSGLDALLPALSSFGSALTSIGTDSLKSGISGMLKGLGTSGFDPVSLGIGAAGMGISLISSIIGGDAQKRKELQKAKEEWEKAGPAFQTFLKQMAGGTQGALSSMFQSMYSQVVSYAQQAEKAKDYAAINRVYEAFSQDVLRTAASFQQSFGGMLDAINSGLGPDSPFASGSNNIKQIGEALKGFVDDVTLAFSNNPTQVAAFGNTSYGGGEAQIAAATSAAQKYMLTLLGQPVVLSETATAIQKMQGSAVQLRATLTELGMSAGDAARAINAGVTKAMKELADTFTASLTERLNTAQGNGYLNDAKTLLKQYQQDTADAAALGLDQAQVAAVFRAEAQKIVDDAGLVGDSFSSFIDLFPQFNGLVGQSATALAAATQKVQAFVKSLNDYLNNLAVGSNSTLSPAAQLAAAQANFSAQMALARAGNDDALGTITQYATTLLDQAKSFYASSGGYTAIYDQVTSALKDLPGLLGAGDGTSKIVGAINSAASQSAQADTQTQALLNTQALLMSTSNSLANSQISLANSQVGILSSIQGLQSTSSAQLDLLNKQYAAAPVTALNGAGGTLQVDNLMIHALNKIVYNTYAIAQNTAGGSVKFGGVYAEGGWITGGVAGRDSVPLANGGLGMPGEFVVRHDIAQANKAWLPDFNSTGRLPMPPMVSRRVGNDNAPAPANDEAKYWRGLAETLIRDGEATRAEIRGLKAEVAASSRDQVDAFKRAPRQMPGTRTGRAG